MIENLNWRYATKQYDTTKKISAENLETLKEVVRLAPTSYGLQPFKVLVIETPELRAQLREKAYNQTQITDASHLFVFIAQKTMEPAHVDAYLDRIAATRGLSVADLQGFGDYMKGAIGYMNAEQQAIWNSKQAYIGLGLLLNAAAELKIDATPMEGFDAAAFNEVLGLTDYQSVVIAALGYRADEDATQHYAKVRKTMNEVFETR